MFVSEKKPSLSELKHYGVKGMRWGVRKAHSPVNVDYTDRMRANDRRRHGKRAVERINQRMNQGQSRDKALEREDIRNTRQRLALVGAVYAGTYLARYGAQRIDGVRPDGSPDAITATLAKVNYVKPNRHGVHKITTMK